MDLMGNLPQENVPRGLNKESSLSEGALVDGLSTHDIIIDGFERARTTSALKVLKKMAEPLDRIPCGAEEEQVKKNINDPELLHMFKKVQELGDDDIHCVKSLLEAYLFKSELKEKLV